MGLATPASSERRHSRRPGKEASHLALPCKMEVWHESQPQGRRGLKAKWIAAASCGSLAAWPGVHHVLPGRPVWPSLPARLHQGFGEQVIMNGRFFHDAPRAVFAA